jgi:two-component system, OmpR family, manganese sensing response regulator
MRVVEADRAMHILLVDDEDELIRPLRRVLEREGYRVDVATEGQTGRQLALSQAYDLLILDWMLPGVSGLEICRQLRQAGRSTPVLFLTAKDTIDDRVAGLDAGADDYLVKPFELRELLARVRARVRRPPIEVSAVESADLEATASDRSKLEEAGLSLDRTNQLAYRNGRTIELSDKETQLLTYLMQSPGQVLGHRQIEDQLWGDQPPGSNVLAAQIRLLRRKIEMPSEPQLIHTVYGKGYRFGLNLEETD